MNKHWRQRPEGGGYLALWLIRGIALYGGRPLARLVLYPVTLYFFLRRGPERRASRDFLSRVFGHRASWWAVLKHVHRFAGATLDRAFMLAHGERGFVMEHEGLDHLHSVLEEGRGVLLIGAHHGSFESLRMLSGRYQKVPLRVVLNKQQSPALTTLLEALAPDIGERVIDGAQHPASVVLALGEAAAQGHMLALLADRGRPDEAMFEVPFLGAPASFPLGPWQLAASLRIPVVLCFGLYLGGRRYRLVFEPFADTATVPRGERAVAVRGWVRDFAARLEAMARAQPYNWFNFYDFWDAPVPRDVADTESGVGDDLDAHA